MASECAISYDRAAEGIPLQLFCTMDQKRCKNFPEDPAQNDFVPSRIVALGTSPNPIIRNSVGDMFEFSKKGTIVVNEETNMTTRDGIYAGGDAVTGAATVILAMGAGRKAAKAIIEKLSK